MNEPWIKDHRQLAEAARMLWDAEMLTTIDDVIYFLERPEKWAKERTLWIEAGRPNPDKAVWSLFLARIQRHATRRP